MSYTRKLTYAIGSCITGFNSVLESPLQDTATYEFPGPMPDNDSISEANESA